MKNLSLVFSLILISSVLVNAQVYRGDYQVFFDYERPDARSEAMGKTQVTLYGSPSSSLYNPASSSFSDGLNVEYTHLDQQHIEYINGAKYYTYGASFNSKKYGAVAFDLHYYDQSNPMWSDWELYNYTLNYSYMPINDLSIGININYFRDNYMGTLTTACYWDLGLLRRISINTETSSQDIFIGASFLNVGNNQASHTVDGFIDQASGLIDQRVELTEELALPSVLKVGVSYDYETKLQLSGFKIFKIMASAEYSDMLNSGLYSYDKLGAEFTVLEALKLRLGYYKEKINGNSDNGNKENLSEFTYGFGVNVPVQKIFNTKYPVSLQFDYASLKAPSYSDIHSTDKHYSVFNLILNVGI
jgi:hypothetical protein